MPAVEVSVEGLWKLRCIMKKLISLHVHSRLPRVSKHNTQFGGNGYRFVCKPTRY